jgi:glutathione S-transferase
VSELVVHQLPGAWGLPSISPFCLKLDAHLRIAGLPFRAVVDPTPFKGPKGKLPWIEHEGRRIGDSGLIIEYLVQRFGCDPDRGLSAADRAVARALRRLIEENLYWAMVYDRWMVGEHWRGFRDVVLGGLPPPVRRMVGPVARRGVRRQLRGHGIGLHTRDEIYAMGRGDIRAVADFLGDKPFLMGETVTGIDAVAYGFLANITRPPIESPLKREVLERSNLERYLERVESRYFGREARGAADGAPS